MHLHYPEDISGMSIPRAHYTLVPSNNEYHILTIP
jgi:hypothetical protein